ncbi:hypothetical protein MCUN1_000916 [Malassezia cuniculi]|uniref:Mitochondrial K+-H+ exchange-related-domain-containing protein n=1 Tax=Malassezia cuniculi TaxID=948313 RepID=A0AAF0ESU0_9BASI|nr:hypothetical protein MCUN1_000916 [Malassezia cuniculi]
MRIIAVPLARRPKAPPLLMYLAQVTSTTQPQKGATPKASWMDKLGAMWINLGRTDVPSMFDWRRRVFLLGERVMDQIGYEEWALKGIDVTTGPSLRTVRSIGQPIDPDVASHNVPVIYSGEHITGSQVLHEIQKLAGRRAPYHRKYLALSSIGIPLTTPLTLLPVVPNLPMYYLMWRYLLLLAQHEFLKPTADPRLDEALKTCDKPPPGYEFVLEDHHIDTLRDIFSLGEQSCVDLKRAQQQTMLRIKNDAKPE